MIYVDSFFSSPPLTLRALPLCRRAENTPPQATSKKQMSSSVKKLVQDNLERGAFVALGVCLLLLPQADAPKILLSCYL